MTEVCPVCGSAVEAGSASCAACGFKLAGSTQSFKPLAWDEGESTSGAAEGAACGHALLRVVRGPQTGTVFELGDRALVIGRNPHCDVFLNDMTVSREHAVVEPDGDGWAVSDSNSYNGVWVNNKSVTRCKLQPGDVVQLGVFLLAYEQE